MTHTTVSDVVSAAWLAAHRDDPAVRVVDVRWYLTESERGRVEYEQAHIPGAVYMSIDSDLAAPPFQGPGRHPLPAPEAFAQTAGRAGIDDATHVVVYDAAGGAHAARLWWLLRYFGHEQVSLLNGGWQAWHAGGYPVDASVGDNASATFTPRPRPEMVVSAADVEQLRHTNDTLILDARAAERYAGRNEVMDKRAGHIPGAKSAPYAENLAADGTLKSAATLKAQFDELGAHAAEQIVCYCGSGVTAAHNVFALHQAGYDNTQLYEGSWSDWSSDANRPIATEE